MPPPRPPPRLRPSKSSVRNWGRLVETHGVLLSHGGAFRLTVPREGIRPAAGSGPRSALRLPASSLNSHTQGAHSEAKRTRAFGQSRCVEPAALRRPGSAFYLSTSPRTGSRLAKEAIVSEMIESAKRIGSAWRLAKEGALVCIRSGLAPPSETM